MVNKTKIVGIWSGVFDPIDVSDILIFEKIKKFVDVLLIIVASDSQLKHIEISPKSDQHDRCKIISSMALVDSYIISIDEKLNNVETIKLIYERYRAKEAITGEYTFFYVNTDVKHINELLEYEVCKEYGIHILNLV
jgi:glycerol-3-phosphate cytidylyltransferase-like family protein